jgi:hypothetical protein
MTRAVLAALAAAALLVGAYLVLGGGGGEEVARPPDACARAVAPAPPGATALDVERLALGALADAACRLRVSRERLLLAVGGVRDLPAEVPDARRDEAIRAALRTTIDTELNAGRLSADQAGLLRAGVDLLPIPELVERLAEGARAPG